MTDEKDLMQIDEGTSAAEGSFGLLSVPEVSKLTGYHRDYVTYLARVGKLEAKKVGRNWVVSREAVDNLLNAANGHTEVADEMGNKIPVHVEDYENTERAKLQKLKKEVNNSISEVKQKAELEKVAQQNLHNAQVIEKQISSKLGDFESNLKKEFELLLDKKVADLPTSAIRVISAPSSVYDPVKFEKTSPTVALSSFDPQADLSKEILAVKTPTLNVEKIYSSFRHRFDLVKYVAYGFAVLTFSIGAAAVYNYKNTEDKIAKIKTEQTQLASKPEIEVVTPSEVEKEEQKIPEIVVTPPVVPTTGETKIVYVVGKPGPQGPRGAQGVQGERGPAGADGKDGANGTVAYQPAYVVTPLPGYTGPNSSGSTFLSGTNISGQELNISGTATIGTATITNLTTTTQNVSNGVYITGNAPYLETTSPGATLFINTVSNNPVEFGSGAIASAGPLTLLSTSEPQVTVGYNSANKWTADTNNTGATTFAFNGATPSVTFTPQNDTTTAFNFTKADGTSVLNVDTTNGRVGINNNAPTVALDITGAANITGNTTLGGNLNLSAVNPVIDANDVTSTLFINTVNNRPVTFGTGNVTIPNLVVTDSQVNSGTVAITSAVTDGTAFSLTGNNITSGTLFSKNLTANAGNGEISKGGTINVVDNTTAGGGYSALTINITGSGTGSGSKTVLDLNPGTNKQVVFDSTGAFRPTVSSAQNTNSIGSPSYYWKNGYFDTINANSLAGTVITGATSSNTWTIGSTEVSDTNKAIVFQRNSGSGNATIQWNAGVNDLRYLTVNYPFNSTYTVDDSSIGTGVNLFSGQLTNNTTAGTQQLLSLTNTGTGTTEKGIYLNNTGTATTAIEVDGTWTNGLLIGPNAGKVGIGTTSPSEKLHIAGNIKLDNNFALYGSVTTDGSNREILKYDSSNNLSLGAGVANSVFLGNADNRIVMNNSSDYMTLSTASTERIRIDSSGNVGIGTSIPGTKLEISGSSGVAAGGSTPIAIKISATDQDNGANTWSTTAPFAALQLYSADASLPAAASVRAQIGAVMEGVAGQNSSLAFYNNIAGTLTESMRLNSSGNAGIGTTNPGAKLEVLDSNGSMARFSRSSTQYIDVKADAGSQSIFSTSGLNKTFLFGTADSNDLRLYTNNSARLNVTSGGSVGIGTTSPAQKLEVSEGLIQVTRSANNAGLILSATGTGGRVYSVQSTDNANTSGGGNFAIYDSTASAYRMVVNSSGYVGIGVTTPAEMLDVFGNIKLGTQLRDNRDNAIIDQSLSTVTTSRLLTIGNSTYATTALMGGNVGIGTSTPSVKLDVKGTYEVLINPSQSAVGDIPGGTSISPTSTTALSLIPAANGTATSSVVGAAYNGTAWRSMFEYANVATGEPSLVLVKTAGNVGIGTTNPTGLLDIKGSKLNVVVSSAGQLSMLGSDETASAQNDLTIRIGANNANSANIIMQKGRSNAGVAVATNDPLGTFQFQGGTGTAFAESARIRAIATGAFSTTSLPSALTFWTTAASSTTVTERMRIDSAGNVGIGLTNPGTNLDVVGNTRTSGYLAAGGSIYTNLGTTSFGTIYGSTNGNGGGNIRLYQDAHATLAQAVQISNGLTANATFINGNVGVGTATPTSLLQINQPTAGIGTVTVTAAGTTVTGTGTQFTNTFKIGDTITANAETHTISSITSDTSMTTDAWTGAATGVAYTLTGGTRFVVKGNGRVGIGTVSPTENLTIGALTNSTDLTFGLRALTSLGSSSRSIITQGADSGALSIAVDPGQNGTARAFAVSVGAAANALYVNASGNIGIGTTNPGALLTVSKATTGADGDETLRLDVTGNVGTGRGPLMTFYAPNNSGTSRLVAGISAAQSPTALNQGGTLRFLTNTIGGSALVERMRIDDSGNVGVGTTAPTNGKLEVAGDGYFSSTGTTYLTVNRNAITNFGMLRMYTGGSMRWGVGMTNNSTDDLSITTDGTTGGSKIYIERSTGEVGIGTTSPASLLNTGAAATTLYSAGTGRTPVGTQITTTNTSATTGSMSGINMVATSVGAIQQNAHIGAVSVASGYTPAIVFGAANSSTTYAEWMRINETGSVGIGTTGPSSRLTIQNLTDGTTNPFLILNSSGNIIYEANVNASGQGLFGISDNGVRKIQLYAGGNSYINVGNVGIGTTAPNSKLQVAGDLATTISSSVYGQFEITGSTDSTKRLALGFNTTGNYGIIQSLITSNNYYPLMLNPNGSGVGIGTTAINSVFNPKLQIKNTATDATNPVVSFMINRQNSDVPGLLLGMDASQNSVISSNGTTGIRLGQNSSGSTTFTEYMRINTGGNIGIGSTNPQATLQVNGDARFGTNGTYTDLRLLTDTALSGYNQTNSIVPITIPGAGTAKAALRLKNVTSGGTTQMDLVVDGNVGVGLTNPQNAISIVNSGKLAWKDTLGSAEAVALGTDTSDALNFLTGSVTRMTISSTGRLGIATSASTLNTLDIGDKYSSVTVDGTNSLKVVDIQATHMPIAAGVTDSGYRIGLGIQAYTNDANFQGTLAAQYGIWSRVGSNTANPTGTITNSYGVYIDNLDGGATITNKYGLYQASSTAKNYFGGTIGIGTTTPSYRIDVSSTANDSTSGSLRVKNAAALGNTSASAQVLVAAIDASGFFGAFPSDSASTTRQDRIVFGTNSDAAGLVLSAASAGQDIRFFSGSSTESMRIDSSGNVGIGITTPTEKLHVVGNTYSTGTIYAGVNKDIVTTKSTVARTIYVDATSGNDTTGTGAVGAPYQTIMRALQDVPDIMEHSYTIQLAAGVYREFVNIRKLGNLSGDTAGAANTLTIQGNTSAPDSYRITGSNAGSDTTASRLFGVFIDTPGIMTKLSGLRVDYTTAYAVAVQSSWGRFATVNIANSPNGILTDDNAILDFRSGGTINITGTGTASGYGIVFQKKATMWGSGATVNISTFKEGIRSFDGGLSGYGGTYNISNPSKVAGTYGVELIQSDAMHDTVMSVTNMDIGVGVYNSSYLDLDNGSAFNNVNIAVDMSVGANMDIDTTTFTSVTTKYQVIKNSVVDAVDEATTGKIITALSGASAVADGATAVAYSFDTINPFTTAGAKLLSVSNAGTEKFTIDKDGNVGIGITAPGYLIHGYGSSPAFAIQDSGANGTRALIQATNTDVRFGNTYSTSNVPILFVQGATTERMRIDTSGNVGIGTTNPSSGLHIATGTFGAPATSGSAANSLLRINNPVTSALGLDVGLNVTGTAYSWLQSRDYNNYANNYALALNPNGGSIGIGTASEFGSGTGVIGIANATTDPTTNPTGAGVLYVSGGALKFRGSAGTVTTVAAADYAEDMPYLGTLTSGEVVQQSSVANPNAEGIYNKFYVERADTPYADGIIGVVSSFQGSNQTTTMPIALVGRVPVKITDENGTVKVGDYLTASASMPGYAMKAIVSGKVIGQVLSAPDQDAVATQVINGMTIQTTTALTFVKVGYQNINNMVALGNDPLATVAAAAVASGNTATTQGSSVAGTLGAAEQGLTMVVRQAVNTIEKDSSGNNVTKPVIADILQLQSGNVTRMMVAASGATTINTSVTDSSTKIFVVANNGTEIFSINAKGTLVASATLIVKKDVVAIGAVLGSTGILARNNDTVEVEQGDLVMFKGVEETDALSSIGMNNPVLSVSKAAYDPAVGTGSVIVVGIADRNMSDFDIPGAGTSAASDVKVVPSGEFLSVITAGTYSAVNADASNSSIAVGDRLTLSTTAGKVRKLAAGENMPVVGIALDNLASGIGKIRIFLNISNSISSLTNTTSTSSSGGSASISGDTAATSTTAPTDIATVTDAQPTATTTDTTTTTTDPAATTTTDTTTTTTTDQVVVTEPATSAPLDVSSSPVDSGTSTVATETSTVN